MGNTSKSEAGCWSDLYSLFANLACCAEQFSYKYARTDDGTKYNVSGSLAATVKVCFRATPATLAPG